MYIKRNRWARLGRDDDKGGDGGAGGGGGQDDAGADDAGTGDDKGTGADDAGKDDDGEPLRPEGVRALQRVKNELEEAKAKLKALDDEKLSKEDRLTRDNGDLSAKLSTTELRATKLEIALDKGLTKSQALRLVGTTKEELEADAVELAKDLGLDESAGGNGTRLRKRPVEKLKGGGAPNDDAGEMDPAKLAAAAKARSGGGIRVG